MTSGRIAVALVACLLLAGCTAPVGTAPVATSDEAPGVDDPADGRSTDPGGPPADGVVVQQGSLDVDANRTFERTQALLGAEFQGTTVTVRDLSAYKSADVNNVAFFRLFGVTNPRLDVTQPSGLTTRSGTVYVSPAGGDPARVEQVLAHEFVHVGQVREGMVPWFGGLSLGRVALDEQLARSALVEGGAVYVTDAYTRTHLPNVSAQSDLIAAQYENGSSGDRLALGQYHFGVQYVNATIDNPSDLASVYDDAPTTTESILHPGVGEEPAALDVSVESNESGDYQRIRSPTGRVGEFVVRVLLRDVVPKERAVAASEGWGNDRVVLFEHNDSQSTSWTDQSAAWVTRWDSETDADEFASVLRNFSHPTNSGYTYRTTRVDERTVVVFAGGETFVASATASGNVTVAV
jgi:uncharacterized protein YjaZ